MITQACRPLHLEREVPTLRVHPQRRIVLVDRDGVINVNRTGYVRCWEDFEFLPGAVDALALLRRRGLRVAVVTNQSAINRGFTTRAAVDECHRRMLDAVAERGGAIEGVFLCPHTPEEGCDCRKPAPGLLRTAAEQLDFAVQDAVLVGDHVTDLQAAEHFGCDSILVLTGRLDATSQPDVPSGCVAVMPDLLAAAQCLVDGGRCPRR